MIIMITIFISIDPLLPEIFRFDMLARGFFPLLGGFSRYCNYLKYEIPLEQCVNWIFSWVFSLFNLHHTEILSTFKETARLDLQIVACGDHRQIVRVTGKVKSCLQESDDFGIDLEYALFLSWKNSATMLSALVEMSWSKKYPDVRFEWIAQRRLAQ